MVTHTQNHVDARDVGAIELVGGEGSRMGPLAWYRTKAALRAGPTVLAAFSSSSALNSGVPYVILVSRYLPRSLRRFYSDVYGSDFGPDKKVDMITPFDNPNTANTNVQDYRGTADAFFQAMECDRTGDSRFLVGLSGDHIYLKDLQRLFEMFPSYKPKADLVLLTHKVPRKDAPRFGIVETDGTRITGFREKPQLESLPAGQDEFEASEGIYFGPREVWHEVLGADQKKQSYNKRTDGNKDPALQTESDIGKDVIPHMLRNNYSLHTLQDDEYWRDVGEPAAFFEAHMDVFIRRNPDFFGDARFRIASLHEPQFYERDGEAYFATGRFRKSGSRLSNVVCSHGVEVVGSEAYDCILQGGSKTSSRFEGSSLSRVIADTYVEIPQSVIRSESGLAIVARKTRVSPKTRIEAKKDAIVASMDAMTQHLTNIISFRNNISPGLELYLPDGTRVEVEELIEKSRRI